MCYTARINHIVWEGLGGRKVSGQLAPSNFNTTENTMEKEKDKTFLWLYKDSDGFFLATEQIEYDDDSEIFWGDGEQELLNIKNIEGLIDLAKYEEMNNGEVIEVKLVEL